MGISSNLPSHIDSKGNYENARTFWFKLMYAILFEQDEQEFATQKIYDITGVYSDKKRFIPHEEFKNLSLEKDGNPIYYCQLDSIQRLLRIVQEAPTGAEREIGAWMSGGEGPSPYNELTISLELNEQTLAITKTLIYYWLFVCTDADQMASFINLMWDKLKLDD